MGDLQFVKKVKLACKSLNIESNIGLHLGRKTALAIFDFEKVSELGKRAHGNWLTDVFGEVHSPKLPLVVMCAIPGFDKRSEMHHNPRTDFYGDDRHKDLAMKIFQ